MRRILVTGGSGMVGQHLKQLIPDAVFISSKDCDLTDPKQVSWLISSYVPHTVIHLAAKVGGIKDNLKYPATYYDDNVLMNTHILRESYKHNVKRFIGILSTCIYPDVVPTYPMKEENLFDGPPAKSNMSYGYAKRSMAVQIDAYNQQYGTEYNYLIPCNLFSELDDFTNENKMHFVTALLSKIKSADTTLNLLGTGKPLRQFMYAGDFARVIKEVVDRDITQSFNVAPDYNHSIKEIAELALEAVGKDLKIKFKNPELDGQYRKDVTNAKLMELLPTFQFSDFKEKLKEVYQKI